MTTKFIKIKHYSRSIGKSCMHCGRPAVVRAVRVQDNRFRLSVWYCEEHAILRGVLLSKEAV